TKEPAPVTTTEPASETSELKASEPPPPALTDFEVAQNRLAIRLRRLNTRMEESRKKGMALPVEMGEELSQAFASFPTATTEKKCASISKKLNAWEDRYKQYLPPP
ncbi:hypothetical protein, partial [Corallococcus sicarius]|uniref:hypothetical protein n=1 Tax=Corallococcus sicarius TaxID=2316726 RepID=UPI001ABFFB49